MLTDPTFDAPRDYQAGLFTLSKIQGPSLEPSALGEIDAVLLSHDQHFDNLDIRGRELLAKVKHVVTTREGAARLGGNAIGLDPFQRFDLTGPSGAVLSITGTPARHGPDGKDRGPVTGFVLADDDPDQEQIYISRDTVWFDGVEETIRRFPQIRVAVLFLGAAQVPVLPPHITFTAHEAVRVAESLPRAKMVPVHFEGWKHLKESKDDVTQAFRMAGREEQLRWLPAGQPVKLVT